MTNKPKSHVDTEAYEAFVQEQTRLLFQNIKNLRIREGMSQEEFAKTLQIPLSCIVQLENRQVPKNFDMGHIYNICQYFDIYNPADLIATDLCPEAQTHQ